MNPGQTYYDRETKIWHGPTTEPRYSLDDSIGFVVLEALRKYPDHISQICHPTGNQFSNRQMAEMSCRVAVHFGRLKLQQTEVVGICAANSDFVAPIFFGAMFSGLCLSTTDPSTNVRGLKHIYSVTKPRVMFCDGDIYGKVQKALQECDIGNL
ncbi:uncharacterized protein LOC131800767 [Musca domestica]|uniref:Uncharacterized protein LOC131800767 n=1 Tax=Musca domestica TaxID=7370 RepID=A0ABM3ULM6_MUSDO|nr:uncharacterized protein LOC131800767 [Musca domestica]